MMIRSRRLLSCRASPMKSKRIQRIFKLLWAAVALSLLLVFQNYNETTKYMLQEVFYGARAPTLPDPTTRATTTTPTTTTPQYANYAYAFVMPGCHPERQESYRGVLYSILVNAQRLESSGSKADILVLVQMSHDSNATTLPLVTLKRLKSFPSIVIRYLPKPSRPPSFYETQFYKFHILKYIRYRRVLFLESDVMPLCSLDYLFELSENGTFKENMALAGYNEPVSSAFMMLRPARGDYEQIMSILESRDANILASSPDLKFDEVNGWGHVIQPPDHWRTRYGLNSGRQWNFPAAFADQGLLYHWIKYVKQNVTLFIGNEIEHWTSSADSTGPVLEATVKDALKGYECPSRLEFPYDKHTKPPYDMEGQMWHFWDEKPWMVRNVKAVMRDNTKAFRAYKMWFEALSKVKRRLYIGFDLEKELRESTPSALSTTENDMKKTLQRKHAYVFLIAGIDSAKPRGYRGIFYSILVNAHRLEVSGSQADIVVLVQMHVKSKANVLHKTDLDRLRAYPNIVIHYLPKPVMPLSFYELQLQKFYILELTQYRRVMYVDADVMLLCNLDYLFHLSERGILKDNIVMAGNNEPAVGHFMMLRPGAGEYKRLMDIVDERDNRILASPTKEFNVTLGWGHTIQSPDRWRARYNRKSGSRWDFPAAYADQGLAYHWVKYVKQSASVFVGNDVENWSSSPNSSGPELESTLVDVLKWHECPARLQLPTDALSQPPYDLEGQMWHFWNNRPWMQTLEDLITFASSDKAEHRPFQMWVNTLDQVKARLNIRINVDKTLRKTPQWNPWTLQQDFQNSLKRKYAYAYLIASCDPENPLGYSGMLYGIMVNAQILENWGSTADIVLMVQMAHDSNSDTLSEEDVKKLQAYPRIVLRYLPKPQVAMTFYEIQLEKFRVLELFQYRRVIFMDADVMPLCNFDYFFHLSETGYFKENMVMAGNNEPANGGFMMLRPGIGEYQQLLHIIEARDSSILESSANFSFDQDIGWGHIIRPPDRWRSRYDRMTGTRWDFSASFCDQGLMYHWAKYVKKSVSLFAGNAVENWSSSDNSTEPVLEGRLVDALKGHECPSRMKFQHDRFAKPPYDLEGQFKHFDGKDTKPWTMKNLTMILNPNRSQYLGYQMWFGALEQVKSRLKIQVDFEKGVRLRSTMKHWSDKQDFLNILKRKGSMIY